ncbi:MAG: zinc-ribbon domain-containing protein [Coriobacteriales bacterium]
MECAFAQVIGMCGGYARVCVRCGLCGRVAARPLAASGVCPRCGQPVQGGARKCPQCGAPLAQAPGQVACAGVPPLSAQARQREEIGEDDY